MWEVILVAEVTDWYLDMAPREKSALERCVGLLEDMGPALKFPYSSAIQGSRLAMRELRYQHRGEPYRVLYAFDPRRRAVLLLGGCKGGDDRWYARSVPIAENRYSEYLEDMTTP